MTQEDCVEDEAKRVYRCTLVFERFGDFRAFLKGIGLSTADDMEVETTILMPQTYDEGQSRLDVVEKTDA